jgi:acyl-CoA thioesterase FadM
MICDNGDGRLSQFYTHKEMTRICRTSKLRLLVLWFLCLHHITVSFQFHNGRPRNSLALSSAVTVGEETVGEETSSYDFCSPVMKVFIEDTDAYGIMYNGNYLRSYDRALYHSVEAQSKIEDDDSWSIVSLGHQKFLASPALGAEFIIQGRSKQQESSTLRTWDLQMTSPDGATVFNIATDLKIAIPKETNTDNMFSLRLIEPFEVKEAATITSLDEFVIHRDEIDAHWTGHIPLRNVLNLFERSRSNLLGGPDTLQRLKENDGILVVVTSVSDCSLIDENVSVHAGQKVVVETAYVIKRKGMIVECFQTLKSACGSRLAQGKITLMMISDARRRPTSKLPAWLKEKLGL